MSILKKSKGYTGHKYIESDELLRLSGMEEIPILDIKINEEHFYHISQIKSFTDTYLTENLLSEPYNGNKCNRRVTEYSFSIKVPMHDSFFKKKKLLKIKEVDTTYILLYKGDLYKVNKRIESYNSRLKWVWLSDFEIDKDDVESLKDDLRVFKIKDSTTLKKEEELDKILHLHREVLSKKILNNLNSK